MERGATRSTRYTQSVPTKFKSKTMNDEFDFGSLAMNRCVLCQSQVDDPLEPWSA